MRACMKVGLPEGERFAIDASVIEADASSITVSSANPRTCAITTIDAEATPTRQITEVAANKTMLTRTNEHFVLKPETLVADAYPPIPRIKQKAILRCFDSSKTPMNHILPANTYVPEINPKRLLWRSPLPGQHLAKVEEPS